MAAIRPPQVPPPSEGKKGSKKVKSPKNPFRPMGPKKVLKSTGNIKDPKTGLRAELNAANLEAQRNLQYGNAQQYGVYGSQTWGYDEYGNPVVKQQLSPEQQRIYESDVALSQLGRNTAQQRLAEFAGQGAFNPNLSARPLDADLNAARSQIEQSTYDRLTRDLEERQTRELDQLQQGLANQGVPQGSDLYRKAMDDFAKRYDRQRLEARQEAVQLGGQELERAFGIGERRRSGELSESQAIRGQQYGEAERLANFGTGARSPQFQQWQGAQFNPANPMEIYAAFEQFKNQAGQLGIAQQQLALAQQIANRPSGPQQPSTNPAFPQG